MLFSPLQASMDMYGTSNDLMHLKDYKPLLQEMAVGQNTGTLMNTNLSRSLFKRQLNRRLNRHPQKLPEKLSQAQQARWRRCLKQWEGVVSG